MFSLTEQSITSNSYKRGEVRPRRVVLKHHPVPFQGFKTLERSPSDCQDSGLMSSVSVHIVVTSWGAPGHLNPIIQLASYLVANKSWKPDTYVTLAAMMNDNTHGKVSLPVNPKIRVITLHEIDMRTWVQDIFGCSETLAAECKERIMKPHKDWPEPSAIVYDMLTPFGYMLADSLNVPGFAFLPSPLFFFWVMRHLSGKELSPGAAQVMQIPGIGELHMDIPDLSDDANPMNRWFKSMMKAASTALDKSKALIANDVQSFYSTEFLDHLRQDKEMNYERDVLCCGPLALMDPRSQLRGAEAASDAMKFLNDFESRSVLFISLGTSWAPNNQDLVELAHGLALSKRPFVFAYRGQNVSADPFPEWAPPNPPADEPTEEDGLPVGFRESVKDRGLIVKWVNQPLLLRHKSVGSFMTHCGWNSVLEGIAFGGVPFLLLPLGGDQKPNGDFLENHLRCGLSVLPRGANALDRHEISKRINQVFEDKEMQKRASSLQEMVLQEASDSGTSENNTRRLFDQIPLKV